jgi:hypothetical protein
VKVASGGKLVWGWLRLLLGLAQMCLATIGLILLLTLGLHPLTLLFVAAATSVTITSWLIYRQQHDQKLNGDEDSE